MSDFLRFTATTACPVCEGTERALIATHGRGGQALETALCTGCGLISHAAIPTEAELSSFYRRDYRAAYKGVFTPKPKHVLRAARGAARRAARLSAFAGPGARVLDVGSGGGEFLAVMTRLGRRATGLEPNEGYAGFARQALGADVLTGGWRDAPLGEAAFDLVVANHVIEHLADPLGALSTWRRWLAPGGALFVEAPDFAAHTKSPLNVFHYAHIWNFTGPTLRGLARRAGLAVAAGAGASLVFRAAPPDPAPQPDPGHAALLLTRIARHTPMGHALTATPWRRMAAKLARNVEEAWTLRDRPTPSVIVVRAMAQTRAA